MELVLMSRVYFGKVLRDFLEQGYSVRWGLLEAADYGVPQKRKRLFIIASWYISSPSSIFILPLL